MSKFKVRQGFAVRQLRLAEGAGHTGLVAAVGFALGGSVAKTLANSICRIASYNSDPTDSVCQSFCNTTAQSMVRLLIPHVIIYSLLKELETWCKEALQLGIELPS